MMIKKGLYVLLSGWMLVSCGTKQTGTSSLDALRAKKDSLLKEAAKINKEIEAVDMQIAQLDTSSKRVTLVTVMPVSREKFQHFVEVQGSVEMKQNAQIFPEVPGEIKEIAVNEGDLVNKGDVIMRIDDQVLRSNIEEVQTALSLAKDMYEKQKSLWEKKIGSEVQYLQAKNQKETLEKKLATLQTQLDKYNVRAPFAGVVDQIFPKEGESANPAMPVARIINMNQAYIKTDVSEDYITVIKKGTYAKIYFPSLQKTVETTVKYAGNYINPQNRTFQITLELPNQNNEIKPNMLADIAIKDYESDSAIVIPSHLIQEDRHGNAFVYVLDQNKAKKINIETGKSYKNKVEILKGLNGNEILIDKGARSLQDGDEVKVVNE
ncbi:MAG: efflux RND transporter periplasmic adaptor subunit [Bacteroidetes bacterium]|nr:MAG: efflux RND transporter periplasmic adaptor subunit [Bacteroidota bacterium]